jgi:hypothetical protein
MVGFVALLILEFFTHQDFFTWLGLRWSCLHNLHKGYEALVKLLSQNFAQNFLDAIKIDLSGNPDIKAWIWPNAGSVIRIDKISVT